MGLSEFEVYAVPATDPCPLYPDADGDGVCGDVDNCPEVANPGQGDQDGDGLGDACDDSDGDGVPDGSDNCELPNPDQADLDGNGVGDACEGCAFHAGTLDNGASDCDDDGTVATCTSGTLVFTSCGDDSCEDDGDAYGGGTCAAVDRFCSAGWCESIASGGDDACGGDADSPSVRTWSCVGGKRCEAVQTVVSDACADTGDELGGGSCSAVDWTCAAGRLSSASTSGVDTCGDGSEHQVSTFACSGNRACAEVFDEAPPEVSAVLVPYVAPPCCDHHGDDSTTSRWRLQIRRRCSRSSSSTRVCRWTRASSSRSRATAPSTST